MAILRLPAMRTLTVYKYIYWPCTNWL